MITEEVIHSITCKKGSNGWMTIKVDLEKSYDLLDQQFLENTLKNIGIRGNLFQLIITRVTTLSFNIIWNSEMT